MKTDTTVDDPLLEEALNDPAASKVTSSSFCPEAAPHLDVVWRT